MSVDSDSESLEWRGPGAIDFDDISVGGSFLLGICGYSYVVVSLFIEVNSLLRKR